MSRIDSGLGWSCDSDYYCDDTTSVVVYNGASVAHKLNAGGAIAVNVYRQNGYYHCAVLSTDQNYAMTDNSDISSVHTAYNGHIDYAGQTWHMYIQGSGTTYTIGDFPTVVSQNQEQIAEPGYMPLTIEEILTAAGVQSTVIGAKVPTTNYVHKYVEGVLKGLPTITNEQIDDLF